MGAWQIGNDPIKGKVRFKIFFPSGADTKIASIKVSGDFLNNNWSFAQGFPLKITETTNEGVIWSYESDVELDQGFYQYKYFLTFTDNTTRIVSDPCTRYSGKDNQNAAFVIGGSQPAQNIVVPLQYRKPLKDLIIYEMNIYDFVADYNREKEAPIAAVIKKLDYIKETGFNAILFMPWTAWDNCEYSWGYVPFQYFAVEYFLANDLDKPAEKLSWLKNLITECHKRDIHVIMDGVFNHVSSDFP